MQVKCVCLFHRIFAFLFMKYHKFYTFFSDFVERNKKAGGFCGGWASPATPSPRAAAQALAPLPVRRMPLPLCPRCAALRESLHPAPPRMPPPRCPRCGQPRALPRPERCQNWLAGLPGAVTLRETPHPPVPQTLLFSLLALAGLPAPPTPRATSHPPPPLTLFSLYRPGEPSGGGHSAENLPPSIFSSPPHCGILGNGQMERQTNDKGVFLPCQLLM